MLENHREWLRQMVSCRKGTFGVSVSIRIVYSFFFFRERLMIVGDKATSVAKRFFQNLVQTHLSYDEFGG